MKRKSVFESLQAVADEKNTEPTLNLVVLSFNGVVPNYNGVANYIKRVVNYINGVVH